MSKIQLPNLLYLCIAIGIAVGSFLFLQNKSKYAEAKPEQQKTTTAFTDDHCNTMPVDTFVHLVTKAYGSLAQIKKETNELSIEIKNANLIAKDFFNGNDALLKENNKNFSIQYNATAKETSASFTIKNNAVVVPNDVLIKISDKIFNAKRTTNTND
jgi:purine-nucleoside phosphorylase